MLAGIFLKNNKYKAKARTLKKDNCGKEYNHIGLI